MILRVVMIALAVCLIVSRSASGEILVNSSGAAPDSFDGTGRLLVNSTSQLAAHGQLYPLTGERREQLKSYTRLRGVWRFVSPLLTVSIMLLLVLTGFSARMRTWAEEIGRRKFLAVWLYLAMFLAAWYILRMPFSIYRGFIIENQYGFMSQSFLSWLSDGLLGLLIRIVVGIVPMWFLYRLIGRVKRWWLTFTVGLIPFAILMVVIVPIFVSPMFNDFEPLKNPQLETKVRALAEHAGIGDADIFEVDASKQSSKINAYVTGLLATKRVVLYDTMIENFTIDEVIFVTGHEMGHYVMHHVWQGLALAILLIGLGLWIIDLTIHSLIQRLRRRCKFNSASDVASLPLVVMLAIVLNLLLMPIGSGFSRHLERQSDRYAMDITDVSPDVAARTFEKLSAYNLSDPDPHPIIEFWFYSHPSLSKRIEFVKNYGR